MANGTAGLRFSSAARAVAFSVCLAGLSFVGASAFAAPPPRLYTRVQAEAGKTVFMTSCASCHGKHSEGISAPANAGRVFLDRVKELGWSIADLRNLVVNNMPYNNPGSLSPKQYAEIMAFLLASDCYPSGTVAFPTKSTDVLRRTKLVPVKGVKPDNAKFGTCHVK